MLITILPVNIFADTNAISVVAKSNMADVKISGDTVNIDITKSVKDLAKMFSKAGKEVKVTLSYFDGKPKEINKTYSDATKFSVKLDTTCKTYYTVEFKPSYFANNETHYGYEYVNLELNGQNASPFATEISTGSTTSVDTNTNTNTDNSNVNDNASGNMDLNDGFFTLVGPTENVSVNGATKYIVSFSKDGKHFKKLCETKKTNYKYKKKIATKQYFRITAVKKVAGKTVKSTPYDLMVYR